MDDTDANVRHEDAPAHNLGILLVHGIGEQPRGDTLVHFGEPILRWIKRWVGDAGKVELETAYLEEGDIEDEEPARFVAMVEADRGLRTDVSRRISGFMAASRSESDKVASLVSTATPTSGTETDDLDSKNREEFAPTEDHVHPDPPQRWMVAESWWAPHFRKPPFGAFARWLLSRGPWVILSHFGDGLREAVGWRRISALLVFLLAIPGALLVQIVVAVVAILALIPWPRLREALSGLLLTLTGTLGDSYVLIESPVQRSAAVTQTRRHLDWLDERCRKVVVIAHSQGTAIARKAIETSETRVALFVTFGQGLKKLEELRYMTDNWKTWLFSSLSFSLPITALAIIGSFYPPPGLSPDDLGTARYFLIAYPTLLLLQVIASIFTDTDYRDGMDRLRLDSKTRWIDFYSRADPVPGGALEEYMPDIISKEVHNMSSVMRDHTSYWDNRDQFVGPLVAEIDQVAGSRLFNKAEVEFVDLIAKRRPRRVLVLALVGWMCGLSALLATYGLQNELEEFGRIVLKPIVEIPLLGAIAEILLGIGRTIEQLFFFLFSDSRTSSPNGFAAVGAALLALIALIWYLFTRRLWYTWDDLAIRPLFREDSPGERNQRIAVGAFVAILAVVPLTMAAALVFGAEVHNLLLFLWHAAWIIPMLPISIGFLILVYVVLREALRRLPSVG